MSNETQRATVSAKIEQGVINHPIKKIIVQKFHPRITSETAFEAYKITQQYGAMQMKGECLLSTADFLLFTWK